MKSSSSISCVGIFASNLPISSNTSPPLLLALSIPSRLIIFCVTGPHFHKMPIVRPRMCLNILWSPNWHAVCSGVNPVPYSIAQSLSIGVSPFVFVSSALMPSSMPVPGRSHKKSYMAVWPLATTACNGRKPVNWQ